MYFNTYVVLASSIDFLYAYARKIKGNLAFLCMVYFLLGSLR
jgi:hypothetical protein